jgi:DNA-binding FrmR family transcriptional regulator
VDYHIVVGQHLGFTACRGAMNGLMAERREGHIRHHVVDPGMKATPAQAQAAQEVIDAVKTYLR